MSGDKRAPELLPRPADHANSACPACTLPVRAGARECTACHFTGSDTFAIFPGPPPPLLPVIDAAEVLGSNAVTAVETATTAMRRRFPQFRWCVCTVSLPRGTALPLFGFWMLNTCPLHGGETTEDRAWTVLLLLDAASGQAAVVPGYAAEPYVTDGEWKSLLAAMAVPWQLGDTAGAVTAFFKATGRRLEQVWKRSGTKHSHPSVP